LNRPIKRGEIWTIAGAKDYAGKPRRAVILQDDRFAMLASVTICALTKQRDGSFGVRLPIAPDEDNGLRTPSRLMVDKITTVSKTKLGDYVGRLADEQVVQLNRAVLVFLGMAGSAAPECT